ncbi:MAG TPA: lytic transglycosylase domain-containing protein [Verrucomicrobiae bacterium]|nr:lytic transglycosylase domain-containing protein [Verrucomicrobiae bacterium]
MTLKFFTIVFVVGMGLIPSGSQQVSAATLAWEDALGQFDESVLTNLDLSALPALTDLDEAQLQAVCRELQKRFQGEYVLELAPLRDMATAALPLLDQHAETQPYAAWLRTRLDYLAVADQLKISIPPTNLELRPPPVPLANPTPGMERRAWQERMQMEDLPPGAPVYVARLKPIFVAEGVPAELVWLAEVESGFDTLARSPSGAAGLFQLMPETAKSLGLALSPWDQRRQPEKNGRAAAKYLKYLYGQFGDWRLSIAAYNAGEGTVSRLLTKYAAHTYDEIATRLPAETQMYVPKVEATILRREGVALEKLKLPKSP